MRFAAPRSASPSPVRRKSRSRSYGIHSDSDSDDDSCSEGEDEDAQEGSHSASDSSTSDEADSSSDESSASSSDSTASACSTRAPTRPIRPPSSPSERRHVDDTIAAIRLRTRHHDPYEDWERQTRKEAFKAARKEQHEIQTRFQLLREQTRSSEQAHLNAVRDKQVADVQAHLEQMRIRLKQDEDRLREAWRAREQKIWERVEGVIKTEEDKVRAKIEAERKAQEAEQARKKLEEDRRRLEEEKRKAEAERKKREEEERKKREEEAKRAEEEKMRKEEEEARAREQEKKKMAAAKHATGFESSREDWTYARSILKRLKEGPMKMVKGHPEMKKVWSAYRRKITPKVGQVTGDAQSISKVTREIIEVISPTPPHPEPLYYALLSSLSKAILLQAETEVTAEKRSAIPLAQVTANLLASLQSFPEIFYAKLAQRAGGWVMPFSTPMDADERGEKWADKVALRKAMGYRNDGTESEADFMSRASGLMRVYFHVLKIKPGRPLDSRFETSRCWVWFARMMGEMGMLRSPIAAELIYAGLDIMGSEAKDIWGHQWTKMLALIYQGVTVGISNGMFIGGEEGKAGRMRVQLEVERIMNS